MESAAIFNTVSGAIYAISKKSLDAYAEGLAMELGLLGISVVRLRPGAVATPIIKSSSEQMNALNNNTVLYKNTISKFKSFASIGFFINNDVLMT